MERYLDEQIFQFGNRKGKDGARVAKAVKATDGKRPTYKALTGKVSQLRLHGERRPVAGGAAGANGRVWKAVVRGAERRDYGSGGKAAQARRARCRQTTA